MEMSKVAGIVDTGHLFFEWTKSEKCSPLVGEL